MVGECGTKRAHGRTAKRKPRPPLDARSARRARAAYVGRFATTRAKLRILSPAQDPRARLGRRAGPADVDAIAERFADLGYVDDAAFALSKVAVADQPRLWPAAGRANAARGRRSRRTTARPRANWPQEECVQLGAALCRAPAARAVRKQRAGGPQSARTRPWRPCFAPATALALRGRSSTCRRATTIDPRSARRAQSM